MRMSGNRILAVDDEPGVLQSLKRVFLDESCEVLTAPNADEALAILGRFPVKVIISDERMPGKTGAELLAMVKQRHPHIIRMMLTGHAGIDAAMNAINHGEIWRFFRKPWDNTELVLSVRAAIDKYDLEAENRLLLDTARRQAVEIRLLEKQFPGIAELRRDPSGSIVVENITQEELSAIVEECQRLFQ